MKITADKTLPSEIVKLRIITKRKRCSICASIISPKAKKCIQCGSYQDARRFLDIGNTSLSLVIAFLTLLLLIFEKSQGLYENIQARKFDVKVNRTIHSIGKDELVVLYRNTGYSEAILPDGIICIVPLAKVESHFNNQSPLTNSSIKQIYNEEVLSEFVFSYSVTGDINQLVLHKEQSQLVTYRFKELVPVTSQGSLSPSNEYNSYCNVPIENVNSNPEWKIEPDVEVFNRSVLSLSALDVFLFQKYLRDFTKENTE
ncbi:hypothetical protein [Vibrio rumoiensis]|uniref:Zinc ribbon domain-containing protein n=1 Tax=Vibrio rumoiensis TaxID=76258 RepID=A0ABW7IVG7_9VIBR